MGTANTTVAFTFRCADDLSLALDSLAKKIGVSKHSLIVFALYETLILDSYSEFQLSNS